MLSERPALNHWQAFAYRAFVELHSCRSFGMGLGPIPWTAVRAWASEHGVSDPDEFAELLFLVTACDTLFLEHESKSREPIKGSRR